MIMQKNRLTVKISGGEYTILADESKEYMQQVAQIIDSSISAILKANHTLTLDRAAILSSLNLADDNYKLKLSEDNLGKQIIDYSNEIKELQKKNLEQKILIASLNKQLAAKDEELLNMIDEM